MDAGSPNLQSNSQEMIVIIDYGMGNLLSVQAALKYLDANSVISRKTEEIATADKLVLPGVGSFAKAMENLRKNNLDAAIRNAVQEKNIPILGICLGMQLLGGSSKENGFNNGLKMIDSPVKRFGEEIQSQNEFKIPHVGFNTVRVEGESKLYKGMGSKIDFYFVHSYIMPFTQKDFVTGICRHGEKFIASFEEKNICGVQFHPEKSQNNGLQLLINFLTYF